MKNFRIWWQKPRRYTEKEDERRISYLELFYDLIYVVIIAELSHKLSADITINSLLEFGFLFLIVWWAWLNGAMYHDNHGNNDIRTRVFTFLQMFTVAAMAIFAHNAFGSGAVGFAISYTLFQLIITFLWWRSGYYDKNHRTISYPYSAIFLIAVILFFASVFFDVTLRHILWGSSLLISTMAPLILFVVSLKKPKLKKQIEETTNISSSLIERFGLITIIVLGEVIVGVIQGVASYANMTFEIGITAALGMLIAIGLWWLYFDTVSISTPRKGFLNQTAWLYLHLPLIIGITATGAAILNIIDIADRNQQSARFLLIGAIVTSYISIAILQFTIEQTEYNRNIVGVARRVTLIAAILSLALLFLDINSIWLLGILSLIMLTPIFFGVRIWVKEQAVKNIEND